MRDQMNKWLDGYSGDYPVWAWVEVPYLLDDDSLLLMTLEVPEERVLLSDFGLWDLMLCCWVDQRIAVPALGRLPVVESEALWLRMFDGDHLERLKSTEQQACIDRVYAAELVAAERIRRKARDHS